MAGHIFAGRVSTLIAITDSALIGELITEECSRHARTKAREIQILQQLTEFKKGAE